MKSFTKITILLILFAVITGCSSGGLHFPNVKQDPIPLKMNLSNLLLFRGLSAIENELNDSTITLTQNCPMCKESRFGYKFNIVKNTSKIYVKPKCKTNNRTLLPDIKGNKTFVPDIYGNLTNRKSAAFFYLSNNNRIRIVISGPTRPSVQESREKGFAVYNNPEIDEYTVSFDFSEIRLDDELVCSLELTDDLHNSTKKSFVVK